MIGLYVLMVAHLTLFGEVQGIAGDGVVVRWLNAMGTDFEAPDYVIKADKLQHWQTTGLEEYMQ